MCENRHVSHISVGKDDTNEIIDDGIADSKPSVYNDQSCRLCRLPKIGSNLVRPNGLRGCNCDKLLAYDKSSVPGTSLDDQRPVCANESYLPHHPESSITENLAGPQNDMCPPKDDSLVPPQGMDTGEFPRALFYQYYPERCKSYTFNLLPLPFMEKLGHEGMEALSMENENIRKKWKDFLYNLPDSEFQTIPYPDDKSWRWKNYLRYKPDERENEFGKKMQPGPKYDKVGRLPITGEELNVFRESSVQGRPKILRKGDGTRKTP